MLSLTVVLIPVIHSCLYPFFPTRLWVSLRSYLYHLIQWWEDHECSITTCWHFWEPYICQLHEIKECTDVSLDFDLFITSLKLFLLWVSHDLLWPLKGSTLIYLSLLQLLILSCHHFFKNFFTPLWPFLLVFSRITLSSLTSLTVTVLHNFTPKSCLSHSLPFLDCLPKPMMLLPVFW